MGPWTSAGVGLLLAGVALIFWWKGVAPRAIAWLALVTGMLEAQLLLSLTGALTGTTILGVGILTAITVFGGLVFWLEAVRHNGHHHIRTPLVGLIVGMALMSAGGSIGQLSHGVQTQVTNVVSHTGKSATGG